MSNLEIYDALIADHPKLQIRAESLIPKMAKLFKKGRKFPSWKWEEYTHQESRNKYLISFYAATPEQADNPKVNYIAFMEDERQRIVIQWGCRPYRRFGSLNVTMVRALSYFFPHFFQRYRERVWPGVEISYNELLCRYFSRNEVDFSLKSNKDIQRNYEEYGEFAYTFQQPDGTCFVYDGLDGDELTIGTTEDNIVSVTLYMTIVTHKMMSQIQKDAIKRGGRNYILNHFKSLYSDLVKDQLLQTLLQADKMIKNYYAE